MNDMSTHIVVKSIKLTSGELVKMKPAKTKSN